MSTMSLVVQRMVPFTWWRSLADASLVVPYYHMVSDQEVAHVSHLYQFRTPTEFAADLEFFLRYFTPLGLDDIVDYLDGRRPLTAPGFHLTFDDGFREMYEVVAPILRRKGVPATFFLNSAFLDGAGMAHHNVISVILHRLRRKPDPSVVGRLRELLAPSSGSDDGVNAALKMIRYQERAILDEVAEVVGVDVDAYVKDVRPYLSSEEVTELLRQGFAIGAHSHDHPLYEDLVLSEQVVQTLGSVKWLSRRFAINVQAFAFPHTDRGVGMAFFERVCEDAGMKVCFGTSGLIPHFYPRSIERVAMEKTSASAAEIVGRQCMRALYYRCGKGLTGAWD